MPRTEAYTPITHADTERIRFFVSFPDYVDKETIGVNVPRLERLCRAGRINALAVVGRTDMDTSSSSHEIVGMTPKGEALAGKAAIKKEPLFVEGNEHFVFDPRLPTTWFNATHIHINVNEAVDMAIKESKGKKGVRDPDVWTRYMDKALKRGVMRAGIHNLTAHQRERFWFDFGLGAVGSALLSASGAFGGNFPEIFLGYSLLLHQIDNLAEFARLRAYGVRDYQWSLFHGVKIDRAAIFSVQAKRGNLIKPLPEPNK